MATNSEDRELREIPIDKIVPNPDNPRMAFRQGELDDLQESIRRYGIQVPISVYRRGREYVLIDGERRWRCASKLNLRTIPAIVQAEPKPLENLLLMFNIHALREQWDLLTIALKLPTVIALLTDDLGKNPTEAEISERTGLLRGVIRRCRLLIALPEKYKNMLLEEIKKPKSKQQISEDFFIEMEKALKTLSRNMPNVLGNLNSARDILIKKYRAGTIDNLVDLRKIPKIARASEVGASEEQAEAAIRALLSDNQYSIDRAFEDTVSEAYAERDIVSKIDSLLAKFNDVEPAAIDDDVREKLEELILRVRRLLEEGE